MAARILGFGSALLDQLAMVTEEFVARVPGRKGGMELVDDGQRRAILAALPAPPVSSPGGSAANTIVALARLGLPARLLAKVGPDAAGDTYRRHAVEAGVEDCALKIGADLPTGTCISLVTPDSERTLRTCLGAASSLAPSEISAADIAGCTHLHAEGYMLFNRDLLLHVLRLAREAGCCIGLDLASPEVVRAAMDILPQLIRDYAGIVYANESEAAAFAGGSAPEAGLRCLAELCPVAVLKCGERGALIQARGRRLAVPACRVQDVLDTTGAGDLWAAGFLYGMVHGLPLDVAGQMGAEIAAEVVRVMGATLSAPTWSRLRSRAEARCRRRRETPSGPDLPASPNP
ncbi:MAG: adenosine kinase [Lentisphaeria bacterium]|nr:adenosine kinase [Lentisphaeria bacterium]